MDGYLVLAFLGGMLAAALIALALFASGRLSAQPGGGDGAAAQKQGAGAATPEAKRCWEGDDAVASAAERGETPWPPADAAKVPAAQPERPLPPPGPAPPGLPNGGCAVAPAGKGESAVTAGEARDALRALLASKASASGRAAELLARLERAPSSEEIARTPRRGGTLRDAAAEEDSSTTMSTTFRPESAETCDSGSTAIASLGEPAPLVPDATLPGAVAGPAPPPPTREPPEPPPTPPPLGTLQGGAGGPAEDEVAPPLPLVAGPPAPPLAAEPLPAPLEPSPPPAPVLKALQFGPTCQQLTLQDPPENSMGPTTAEAEEEGMRQTLNTMRRNLGRRDAQTTGLHRQLRDLRAQLFEETTASRATNCKLNALLADPALVQAEQAAVTQRLQQEVSDLSVHLADTRKRERRWLGIARQQRLYFMQSEHVQQQEDASALKKHPAGEVFLAPAPLPLDEEELMQLMPRRDQVAQSYCDPYSIDSWPFEPNALAARNNHEPQLQEWDEGDELSEPYDDDDDVGSDPDMPPGYLRADPGDVGVDDGDSLEGIEEPDGTPWPGRAEGGRPELRGLAADALPPAGAPPDSARSL